MHAPFNNQHTYAFTSPHSLCKHASLSLRRIVPVSHRQFHLRFRVWSVKDEIATQQKVCACCGDVFQPRQRGRPPRFCGHACRNAAYRRRDQDLPENLPRWERRGQVAMSELDEWQELRRADAVEREARRLERERLAAQRRAWKAWRHSLWMADRRLVRFGTRRSFEAVDAWRGILAALQQCRELRVPGVRWDLQIKAAEEHLQAVDPTRAPRAERRRHVREARKAARLAAGG